MTRIMIKICDPRLDREFSIGCATIDLTPELMEHLEARAKLCLGVPERYGRLIEMSFQGNPAVYYGHNHIDLVEAAGLFDAPGEWDESGTVVIPNDLTMVYEGAPVGPIQVMRMATIFSLNARNFQYVDVRFAASHPYSYDVIDTNVFTISDLRDLMTRSPVVAPVEEYDD